MDTTYLKDVFPKVRAKTLLCTFFLIFLTSLDFPSVECIDVLPDWDLAVAHGTKASFISINSAERRVVQIPVPTSLTIDGPFQSSRGLNTINTYNTSHWMEESFLHFSAGSALKHLFFVSYNSLTKLNSIIVFDIASNLAYILQQSPSDFIDGLVFHDERIFWSEANNNTIWQLNISQPKESWKPKIFYKPPNCSLHNLAVDTKSNTFFWINTISKNFGKIQFYDEAGNSGDVVTGITSYPLALTTDDLYLYWTEKSGTQFKIERVRLANYADRKEIHSEHYHQSFSLSVVCFGSIFWTSNNNLWYKENIYSSKLNNGIQAFGQFSPKPRGIISKSSVLNDWDYCKKKTTTTSEVETSTLHSISSDGDSVQQTVVDSGSSNESSVFPHLSSLTTNKTVDLQFSHNSAASVTDLPNQPFTNNSNIPAKATSPPTVAVTASNRIPMNVTSSPVVLMPTGKTTVTKPAITAEAVSVTFRTVEINTAETTEISNSETYSTPGNIVHKNSSSNQSHHYFSEIGNDYSTENLTLLWCPKERNNCLNGGHCVLLSNVSFCLCLQDFEGSRCEHNSILRVPLPLVGTSDIIYIIVCSGLSFLVVILVAAVVFLYVKIRKVDKKPRIRRRVIVSRSREGVRRRERERGSSVCELIDIENCCNMNECETPCYETSGSSSASTSSSKEVVGKRTSRKEDKERLIET